MTRLYGRARFIAQLEQKEEFRILNALMDNVDVSPAHAVDELVAISENLKVEDRRLGNHLYDTACSVLELAKQASLEDQAKLVTVVHTLHQITILHPTSGEPLTYDGDLVWRDLPTFGYTFVDDISAYDALASTSEEQVTWENLTAFFAQLTARSEFADVYTDYSRWALTPLIDAFGPLGTSQEPAEHALRAACNWLIYASDTLWYNIIDDAQQDWSRDEWNHWKSSLARIRETSASPSVLGMVDDALTQMNQAES